MDRMNPLDASFLYLEEGTYHMHVGSLSVFEGPIPDQGQILDLFRAKLPLVPRYRQRPRFVPLDLGRPVWVDDPHFDLEYHVRRTAVPPPGDAAHVERLVGRLMSQELDRARPLWETWIVDGLAGGRWAMISKVHHCMIDGMAGVDLIQVVLDHTPEPAPAPADDWRPDPAPGGLRLTLGALGDLALLPARQLQAAGGVTSRPGRALGAVARTAAGVRAYAGSLRPTPASSLAAPVGPHRRWTSTRVALDDVRTIRKGLGGTVNDVVLAAVTRGFRDLVTARGDDPTRVGLRTLVPVSVRPPDAHGVLDNRVSAIYLDLPLAIDDPQRRLAAVRREMARLKASGQPEAGEVLTSLVALVPPAVTAGTTRLATRLLRGQRLLGTVTTNVPGPPGPLYAAGREMLEYLPYVPLGPGMPIGVAILSYNGTLGFGITGDHDAAPDIDVVAAGIRAEVAALLEAATAPPTRPVVTSPAVEPFMADTDAVAWYMERDPVLRSTIVSVTWLEGSPDWAVVRERMERATRAVPRFRMRPVEPPLRLAPPRWVLDPDFDLDWHLRRIEAPGPDTVAAVLEVARRAATTAFDPAHPLWELTLVEGVAGDRAALVLKLHHSLTDGLGGMRLALNLFDGDEVPLPDGPMLPLPAPEAPTAAAVVAQSLARSGQRLTTVARRQAAAAVPGVLRLARHPARTGAEAVETLRSVGRTVAPVTRRLSPVMTGRGLRRELAVLGLDLADLKAAAAAAGGTVNDAFLAGLAGGFRRYHDHHGSPVAELRVTMPISIRTDDDPAAANRITLQRFTVPVGLVDPALRVRAIGERCARARAERSLPHTDTIAGALNLVPPEVLGAMLKRVDFLASNVPGFPEPVYLAGTRVTAMVPFGPTAGSALNATLLSYDGRCTIGLTIDTAAVGDPDVLVDSLAAGLEEVLALGGAAGPVRSGAAALGIR